MYFLSWFKTNPHHPFLFLLIYFLSLYFNKFIFRKWFPYLLIYVFINDISIYTKTIEYKKEILDKIPLQNGTKPYVKINVIILYSVDILMESFFCRFLFEFVKHIRIKCAKGFG